MAKPRGPPQRRAWLECLAATTGHVPGAELVGRCRAVDSATVPSTVYRTLDVLEELGYLRHAHGVDGREEFHVLPHEEHGHLHCVACGGSWEINADEARALLGPLRDSRGFAVDLSHLSIAGRCSECSGTAPTDSRAVARG